MSPDEFKARYIASLPDVPADLGLRLDDFVVFPAAAVDGLNIGNLDKSILTVSGLPRDASPFLSFRRPDALVLQPLSKVGGVPDSYVRYRMIGQNGYGDMICIDEATNGTVVYLNHDRDLEVVFINSNVTALAQSLCYFAEFMKDKDAEVCGRAIRGADPPAMASGRFWPAEIDSVMRRP